MKKTYIKPLVEVDGMETEQMICESVQFQGTYNDDSSMTIAGKEEDEYDFADDLW